MARIVTRIAVPVFLLIATLARPVAAPQQAVLTKEEIQHFLLKADIVKSRQTSKGITNPWRLTLSDGKMTHDAAFQSVDQKKAMATFDRTGKTEVNFTDSYKYNIAAYQIAELLGLDNMVPVTVERSWRGSIGSLAWWVDDVMMDEQDRERLKEKDKEKATPPDTEDWNRQTYRMRVFTQLLYDTDRNMTNLLIDKNWKIWLIDFSRGFRGHKQLQAPAVLTRCDRQLLEKLRQLRMEDVLAKTKPHLSKWDVEALMVRRDLIVAHFDKRIAAVGEHLILY